jgi:hypothetical protein
MPHCCIHTSLYGIVDAHNTTMGLACYFPAPPVSIRLCYPDAPASVDALRYFMLQIPACSWLMSWETNLRSRRNKNPAAPSQAHELRYVIVKKSAGLSSGLNGQSAVGKNTVAPNWGCGGLGVRRDTIKRRLSVEKRPLFHITNY